jgi:ribosomal protein L13
MVGGRGGYAMAPWVRPAVIIAVVVVLVVANVVEFTGKRRADQAVIKDAAAGSTLASLQVKQYQQTQNIEQLLHVISTMLVAILVALLWT